MPVIDPKPNKKSRLIDPNSDPILREFPDLLMPMDLDEIRSSCQNPDCPFHGENPQGRIIAAYSSDACLDPETVFRIGQAIIRKYSK